MTWKQEELIELFGMAGIGDEMIHALRVEARQNTGALLCRVRARDPPPLEQSERPPWPVPHVLHPPGRKR